jgi:hypothetical protein
MILYDAQTRKMVVVGSLFITQQGEKNMSEPDTFKGRTESYIVVVGPDGEEYICPQSAIKKKAEASEEELKNCVAEWKTGGGATIGG